MERDTDGHLFYEGTCSVCGKTIIKRKNDFVRKNKVCQHKFIACNIKNKRIKVIFSGMKGRCYNLNNEDYNTYGGRGITICDEWLYNPATFEVWALSNGYMEHLTIDRINSDLGYCPQNCRWVTQSDNAKYKSTTHMIEIDGQVRSGKDWAKSCGIGINTINKYLRQYPYSLVIDFIKWCLHCGAPKYKRGQSYIEAYLSQLHTLDNAA